MTEINTPRENRSINVEPIKDHVKYEIANLVSTPVYGGHRCSYILIAHGSQTQISGHFVSTKSCPNESNLAEYLKSAH